MEIDIAQEQKEKHDWLLNVSLVHKTYNAAMRVTELEIAETAPGSNDFYVCCRLQGALGEVAETLGYVLENYEGWRGRITTDSRVQLS